MNSPLEEIKSRLDVVELIQSYIRLQKAGINYKANCPFHGEKTPSFFVSPSRQIWHCFGCGKGGDVFKFIMEIEGHDFPEAMRLLADRAGVLLKREDPVIRSERNRLYDICEETTRVFEKSFLLTPAARTYMKNRGVSEITLKEFRVGFAPQSWDYLLKVLSSKGFKPTEIEKAGLAIKSENGSSWYDRFRSRIMFPITDISGRTAGFSGRIFLGESDTKNQQSEKTEAKYVNTPNTLIYDKSHLLYGFDKAKKDIQAQNKVVVVEGQMDCLMSHQAGVRNTIAVSGTALTPQQLKVIRRLCDTMVSSFDTDAAGESATRRSLALASEFGFERRIAVIPSGKDPADAVKQNPDEWLRAIKEAKPVVEFYFDKAFREYSPRTSQGKKDISASLLPWIAELSNEIEKEHWVRELSKRLETSEEAIKKELRKVDNKTSRSETSPENVELRSLSRRELLEERLLALLSVVNNMETPSFKEHHLVFTSEARESLFSFFLGEKTVIPPELQKQAEVYRFKGEVLASTIQNTAHELVLCRKELEKECIKESLQKLSKEIGEKEHAQDTDTLNSLLKSFNTLSVKLRDSS